MQSPKLKTVSLIIKEIEYLIFKRAYNNIVTMRSIPKIEDHKTTRLGPKTIKALLKKALIFELPITPTIGLAHKYNSKHKCYSYNKWNATFDIMHYRDDSAFAYSEKTIIKLLVHPKVHNHLFGMIGSKSILHTKNDGKKRRLLNTFAETTDTLPTWTHQYKRGVTLTNIILLSNFYFKQSEELDIGTVNINI